MATKMATIIFMKSSFKLRKPNLDKPTPIYFTVFFKEEKKSLVYATGKNIHPVDWDFVSNTPKNKNLKYHSTHYNSAIRKEMSLIQDEYEKLFLEYDRFHKKLTSTICKSELDERLNRVERKKLDFFTVYDMFLESKKNDYTDNRVSDSTRKRYKYLKTQLHEFQAYRKKKFSFNDINSKFYNELLQYFIQEKKHSANTLHRNIGLFKTFMYWAFEKKLTNNDEFKDFKKPRKQPTTEIALDIDKVKELYNLDLSSNIRLERVRDLFIIGCTTGQRFSNYSSFSKSDIVGDEILVPDFKNPDKLLNIPLLEITKEILIKYDFNLPEISNQKFNKYIKEIVKIAGFDENTKKIIRIGKEIKEDNIPMWKRVSSHTARRSFITIMLNAGVPPKIIMSITGHKSLPVFNAYYKPDSKARLQSMKNTFQKLKKQENE